MDAIDNRKLSWQERSERSEHGSACRCNLCVRYWALKPWPGKGGSHSKTHEGELIRILMGMLKQGERLAKQDLAFLWDRYRQSKQWDARRLLVYRRANGVCESCGTNPVADIHHITYRNRFNEALDELIGLCRECHQQVTQSMRRTT